MNEAFEELAEFCHTSDDLTLTLLRQKLEAGPDDLVRGNLSDDVDNDTTLLHYACYNRRVTLDIVRHLVSLYPEAVKVQTDYGWLPLHRACSNAACPDDVVEYLVDLYPDALGVPWAHRGLPLHCLLSRPTSNNFTRGNIDGKGEEVRYKLNLDLVRMLVEARPEALTDTNNDPNSTPLLCACGREDVSMDLVRLLVDPDLSVLGLAGGYNRDLPLVTLMKKYHGEDGWRAPFDIVRFFVDSAPGTITPSVLNEICGSRNVTLETVKLIIESRADVSFLDQADDNGMLPLHCLCLNDNKKDKKDVNSWLLPIIEYVVDLYPESVRRFNSYGFLPFSYATSTTLEITQFLVEKYPESVTVLTPRGNAFHSACRSGGIATLKYLFEKNPGAINSTGYPALHLPFEGSRDVEAKVDFILEKDPHSIKAKDPRTGNLPLHAACSAYRMNLSLMEKLFYLYPDAVATRNLRDRFPLHEFLAMDRIIHLEENWGKEALEGVTFLVTQFPCSVRVADDEGMLPLHHASKYYNTDIVKYLAKAYPGSAKVESQKFGLPLHCAAGQRKSGIEIIDYLLSLYPEAIGARNENVGIPLEGTHCMEIFEHLLLLRNEYLGKRKYHLHHVLQDGDILNPDSVVRDFLQYFSGNVTEIDNFGKYPLHVAVSSPRASHFVVKEFLDIHPAAALRQDKRGCIPLHLFLRHCASLEVRAQEEIFDELLRNRIDTAKVPDRNGCLPLHFACRDGTSTTVLGKLTEYFPEAVGIGDCHGCIPLHVACRRGMLLLDTIKLLVGFDTTTLQTKDEDLELPLHKACRGGHLEIIHYLLDQFAPASGMRNVSDYLPLHLLCQKSGKADLSIMDTPQFTDTVFRLLRTHPEVITCATESAVPQHRRAMSSTMLTPRQLTQGGNKRRRPN